MSNPPRPAPPRIRPMAGRTGRIAGAEDPAACKGSDSTGHPAVRLAASEVLPRESYLVVILAMQIIDDVSLLKDDLKNVMIKRSLSPCFLFIIYSLFKSCGSRPVHTPPPSGPGRHAPGPTKTGCLPSSRKYQGRFRPLFLIARRRYLP